jgi:hypothetical protein
LNYSTSSTTTTTTSPFQQQNDQTVTTNMLSKHFTFVACIFAVTSFKGTLANRGNPTSCGAPFCVSTADMDVVTDNGGSTPTSTAIATLAL